MILFPIATDFRAPFVTVFPMRIASSVAVGGITLEVPIAICAFPPMIPVPFPMRIEPGPLLRLLVKTPGGNCGSVYMPPIVTVLPAPDLL